MQGKSRRPAPGEEQDGGIADDNAIDAKVLEIIEETGKCPDIRFPGKGIDGNVQFLAQGVS
jgi:hypothetical protein